MRLLLSDAASTLGAALAAALGRRHDLRPLAADPRDAAAVAAAADGVDAMVHVLPLGSAGDPRDELDALDRATRGTYVLLTGSAVPRVVLVSSLRPFARYPADWLVDEHWAPRPTDETADLVPYLAEVTAREVTRARPVAVEALRLGVGTGDAAPDPGAATEAVEDVLARLVDAPPGGRWRVVHAGAWRPEGVTPSELPTPAPTAAAAGATPRPERVVIFGAGGPLGAATAAALAPDHRLRLTDVRPIAEAAAAPPQSSGAPRPVVLTSPHEERIVDVTDPEQVMAAVAGMDAIVNCAVIRHDPVEAFRVNLLGARNVMRAAVAHGIRRVVHTGPIQTLLDHPAGYAADFGVAAGVPPRPGDNLYFVSKFLGQEVCRIVAEERGLEVPTLLFGNFVEPSRPPAGQPPLVSMTVSWGDAAAAMRLAVDAPGFPRPFQILHVNADLPHGQYPNDAAKRLLAWQPRDRLEAFWMRQAEA